MPVSYPAVYSIYLAKKQGTYATLGLAEDTWALNEGVLNDDHFIQQCLDMDNEREAMFFDALDKVPRGLVACVFDGTDRLQHTFWRDIDPTHPARPDPALLAKRNVIEDLYTRMDDLVGKTMEKCRRQGHAADGHLRPWLRPVPHRGRPEPLAGRERLPGSARRPRRDEEHLAGVDWSRTRAFAIGLAGIFINLKEKYDQGIVDPGGEADQLREEIARRLETLIDPATGESAVKRVYIAGKFYRGPYKDNAPDLIVGYQRGYRVSWEAAIGKTTDAVFHPNTKAWSGDHCVDPSLVPGILFCNHPIAEREPAADRYRPHRAQHVRRRRPRLHGRQGTRRGHRPGREDGRSREETLAEAVPMTDQSSRKLTRRTLIAGTAAAATRGAAGLGAGNYWLGCAPPCLAQRRQEGDRRRHRRHGPSALGAHDERGPAAQPREAARRRRLQHAGHQHAAAEPRRLGQLHQRRRARRSRDLRLHPPRTPTTSAHRSTPQPRPSPAKGPGDRRAPDPARFLAVQSQAAQDRAQAPGRAVLGLPRRGGRALDLLRPARPTIRPARRTTATIAASAGWARPDMLGTYGTYQHFAENGPPETTDEAGGGGKRSRLTFEGDTARAPLVGPDDSLLKNPAPVRCRVPRPSRPRGQRRRDRDPGPQARAEGRPVEPLDQARLQPFSPVSRSVSGNLPLLPPGSRADLPALCLSDQHRPGRPRPADLRAGLVRPGRVAAKLGPFATTGFQEDYAARKNDVFTDDEYARQADMVLDERLALLDYAVDNYEDGLLFFYFSSSDLQSHMFWWDSDETHPIRSAPEAKKYFEHVQQLYRKLDKTIGELMDRYGQHRNHHRHERPRLRQLRPAVQSELVAAGRGLSWGRPSARRS